uniref:T-complex protein 1 subunit delta n=1 Tax=Hirondellea gigas TaxID=1518452 RepID=A0A6A7G6F9_9CRUS
MVKGAVKGDSFEGKEKQKDVRRSNILAARGVADAIRTSLGPKGMDKMITSTDRNVVITNDGATVLKHLEVVHPAARMLVELSKSQDVEAGDGTTSVVVLAGSLLEQSEILMDKGIRPGVIADGFKLAAAKAEEILREMAQPVTLDDDEKLTQSAIISLSSKVVASSSSLLAPIAVKAVKRIIDLKTATNVDLNDIRVLTKLGGTVEDTELVDGLVFNQKAVHAADGPTLVKGAKIGLIQFQLSAPKPDMDNSIYVKENNEIDRIFKEERKYILSMIKIISKSGCNVLLIQKSILRDAVNSLSLHFLAKKKIMVITDIERDEVEFICKSLDCHPIATIDGFTSQRLGSADLAREVSTSNGRIVKITGVKNPGKAVSILVRGSNRLVLEEAERSLHDALCVIRCLVKERFTIPGGGAPEIEVAMQLSKYADSLGGLQSYCVKAFCEALEVIPYTLAENCGLHPIQIVTELRREHRLGNKYAGINVRKGKVTDMLEENVIQPVLVSTSAINLASECVRMLLKIDDIVATR